jgi:membrane protease YdiL (CAAX protease family)
MESRNSFQMRPIIILSIIVMAIDLTLGSFIQMNLNEEIVSKILIDVLIIILTGYIGLRLVSKVNFPLWWRRYSRKSNKKQVVILIFLGLAIIIPNTLIYYFSQNLITTIPWLSFSNLKEPILLALRAGIQEQIVYRLFIFTLATYLVNTIIDSKTKSVMIGIILSSIVFGLLHGFYFAYLSGALLAYIFYKNGLIPAMIVHFLADAVPWTLMFILRSM